MCLECESRTVKQTHEQRAQRFWSKKIEANFEGFVDWKENQL